MEKIYLVLEQGTVFEGYPFGALKDTVGEIVFNTGTCNYIEMLSDACNAGQILVQTFPLIGNYGMIEEDLQGEAYLNGYVTREWCEYPSNFRAQYTIDAYMKEKGIPGIYGVDTREITRLIREHGVMNAAICRKIPEDLSALENYRIVRPVETTGAKAVRTVKAEGEAKYRIAVIDCGSTHGCEKILSEKGCDVTLLPYDASAAQVLEMQADALLISDGPGDPKDCGGIISAVKELLGMLPIFGIGLGHQILALAGGADTIKLKHGHRGGNQPVRELNGTKTYITTQNHGYAVDPFSLPDNASMIYGNANDDTCEGIAFPEMKAFSVQFIPEGDGSPFDTLFIYDKFLSSIGGKD